MSMSTQCLEEVKFYTLTISLKEVIRKKTENKSD